MDELVTSTGLPKLMSRKDIAAQLGVKLATAETIMRNSKPFNIKRRVFVYEADVLAYLERQKKQ